MDITEVRIKLMDDPHDRLQAFCSVTFDACFVIRDLKIIQGTKGSFVAMTSRKLTDRCPKCHCKNHLRSQHCNQCGAKLDEERATKDNEGRAKLYADIAHPINSHCRELIQTQVLDAFTEEQAKSKEEGYICTYDDYGEERFATLKEPEFELDVLPSPVADEDTSRRIEPAASQPGPPHHDTTVRSRENAVSAVEGNFTPRSDNEETSFGAGIV